MTGEEIQGKIMLLETINRSKYQIINIISSNLTYLNQSNIDIIKLINILSNYKFTFLNILFDANFYIFNLDAS